MIIAVDTHCILPGKVGGIENYTLGLVEALKLPQSPAEKLILLVRAENRSVFERFGDAKTELVLIERPIGAWSPSGDQTALGDFQRRKAEALHCRGVDVVHFPGNTINPIDLDLPVVLNLHDLQHRRFPQYFSAEEIAGREKWWVASGRRADALIAGSNFIRDDLCEQLDVEASKIFVTPDIFESAFFGWPNNLEEIRGRFELPPTFFLYPAAVWPHKNHRRLIEAFTLAGIPGAQLVLTGGGSESLELAPGVRHLGRVSTEDLIALYHLATALVFPSEYEAWSIPIMEAMACDCPVASSIATSLAEQVGNAGLLFDPTSVPEMARAMRHLAEDDRLRQTLVSRGRYRVRQLTPDNFLKTITRAYGYAVRCFAAKKAA